MGQRAFLLIALLIGVVACGDAGDSPLGGTTTSVATGDAQPTRTGPYRIVVTLPLFADFVREIGGDRVTVTALIPAGADPHTYVPTEDQAGVLADSDIVFVNGGGLEGPTFEFIEGNRLNLRLRVIQFAGNVPSPSVEQPLDKPIYATEVGDNPHLYLNPLLGKVYPETVSDSLYQLGHDEFYRARFQSYFAELRELDAEIVEKLATLPPDNRVLVTHHDAFLHFAKRYGLTWLGSTFDAQNAPQASLAALEDAIRTSRPASIFIEAGFDAVAVQQLAEQTGVKVCRLYSDILDEEVTTYFEMLRSDADEVVRCLR